jgi:hypothetical protein
MEASNQANDYEERDVRLYNLSLKVLGRRIPEDPSKLLNDSCLVEHVLKHHGVMPRKFKKYEQRKHWTEWSAKLIKAYNDNIHLMAFEPESDDEDDDVVLK